MRTELPGAMEIDAPIVLLVDDDDAVRHALAFALHAEGFCVRSYASSAKLLEETIPCRKCLLITDYRMPDVDGLELIERLRCRKPDLPVILISGLVNRSLRGRAVRLGVSAVLEKPLSGPGLVETIQHILQGSTGLPPPT